MSQMLEAAMILSFGAAWPASIMKSWRTKSARGKSIQFLILVFIGYACGIASKFLGGNISYVLVFYIINICMVACDIALYYRNLAYDKQYAVKI